MRQLSARLREAAFQTQVVRQDLADGSQVTTFTGRSPFGLDQWVYLPFEVSAGMDRITVTAAHQRFTAVPWVAKNVLDLGLFDQSADLRGWSGGARTRYTVSAHDATPGYLPGPIAPGTWAVALGPVVMNPAGMPWKVRVRVDRAEPTDAVPTPDPLTTRVPVAEAERAKGAGWFRGDMHVHTEHSDGVRTLEELAGEARERGLDFVASTDHNTISANRSLRDPALAGGGHDGLLIIPGTEVTTRHGHWLAIGLPDGQWVDWRYRPGDATFPAISKSVRDAGGIVVAAHPKIPVPGAAWEFGYDHVDAVEVWNSRWTPDDQVSVRMWDKLLRQGRRVVAVANSDSHSHRDAVRQGRAWLSASADVTVELIAASDGRLAEIGDTLETGHDVEVTAAVSGAPWSVLKLVTAGGVAARAMVGRGGCRQLIWRAPVAGLRYVRLEVRRCQPGRTMTAMTNPIWLT
jgi:predicted metal-dependent phosphoesterase TrpH